MALLAYVVFEHTTSRIVDTTCCVSKCSVSKQQSGSLSASCDASSGLSLHRILYQGAARY